MEGKESQKDILRLRHLETGKHENGSTSIESERMEITNATNSLDLSNEQNSYVKEPHTFVNDAPAVFEIPTQTLIQNDVNN